MAPRPFTSRRLDLVYFIFFITHIPITLLLDSYPILPKSLVPTFLIDLNTWFRDYTHDPLYSGDKYWFHGYLTAELYLQVPFFMYAVRGLWNDESTIRLPLLVYATHTATAAFACLTQLFFDQTADFRDDQRSMLLYAYGPFFLLPLAMAVDSYQKIRVFENVALQRKIE